MSIGGTQQASERSRTKRSAALGIAVGIVASMAAPPPGVDAQAVPTHANPDLGLDGCGVKTVVLLDESASISSPIGGGSQVDEMQAAVAALVDGLTDTNSQMRFVEFSTNARDVDVPGFGTGFQAVTGSFPAAVKGVAPSYMFPPAGNPPTANANSYNPGVGQNSTNWEAALTEAWSAGDDTPASAGPDGTELVIFVTDGNPTTSGINDSSSETVNTQAQWEATFQLLKNQGFEPIRDMQASPYLTHVLAIGVGDAFDAQSGQGSRDRLEELVVGDSVADQWGDPGVDVREADVLYTGFDGLANALRQLSGQLCEFQVTKDVDTTANPGKVAVASGSDLTVTYDITVSNNGPQADEYDLVDTPAFSPGTTIKRIKIESADVPAAAREFDHAGGPFTIADNQSIPGNTTHTFTVTATFTPDFDVLADEGQFTCSGASRRGQPGEATFNQVTVTFVQKDRSDTAEDCADIPEPPDGDIEVTKVDQYADGQDIDGVDGFVVPGQLFQYSITVSNTDDAESLQDVNLTDSIPSGLAVEHPLVFDDGDWDCDASSGSSIDCDYLHVLSPGGTTSAVVVPVRLAADFAGAEITNTAFTKAIVVVPDPFEGPEVDDSDPETTPVRSLNGTVVTADCVQDAPWIKYTINPIGFTPSGGATIRLLRKDNNAVLAEYSNLPLPAGQVLYPGAAVDAQGNGTDWPGWKLQNGQWVLDPSDAFLRDGVNVEITVNPTLTLEVGYPAAKPECASPPLDLALTKTDNGATPSPGQSFDYTIVVTNVGGTDPTVNPTVTDVLPAEFQWVSPAPAGCSFSGQTMSCTLQASSLEVGESVTITPKAMVRPTTLAADPGYVNLAWVDSPEDPACTQQVCSPQAPPPCPTAQAPNNNVDCEPTPVPPRIDATLLTADCVLDAPWIKYTITPVGFTPSGGATITLRRTDNDAVVATYTNQPLSGQVLYPGAAVDAQGNGTDWPGWKFENGRWVLDDADAYLREGLDVTIEVNPTTTGSVTYPAADSACADPEQVESNPPPNPQQPTPTTTTTVPPRSTALPPTGSDTTLTGVTVAMFLVTLGAGALLSARRRIGHGAALRSGL